MILPANIFENVQKFENNASQKYQKRIQKKPQAGMCDKQRTKDVNIFIVLLTPIRESWKKIQKPGNSVSVIYGKKIQ